MLNLDKGLHVTPSIDGTDVVWFDMSGSGTLHSYDLAEKRARPSAQGRYPKVQDGLVVLKSPRDGGNATGCSWGTVTASGWRR